MSPYKKGLVQTIIEWIRARAAPEPVACPRCGEVELFNPDIGCHRCGGPYPR